MCISSGVLKYQRLGQGLLTWIVDFSDRCQKNESIRNRVEWAPFLSLSRASPEGAGARAHFPNSGWYSSLRVEQKKRKPRRTFEEVGR